MCLSPIRIKNKSKYFNLHSFHKISLDVPCGSCAECIAAKQNEYYFRTYYQCLDCWKNGGYVLFDTLTYDSEHLPHMSDFVDDLNIDLIKNELDFPCFNYEDIRYFIVRLRRALEYDGYDVKNKLKYFVCSEYGTDPRYTHRPHYHILVFVLDDSLDPLHLSKVINECWGKGITDGCDYNGYDYVLSKRVFKPSDELHARCVSNYVGKYLTKDSSFQSEIDKRLDILESYIVSMQRSENYSSSVDDVQWIDLFRRDYSMYKLEKRFKDGEKVKLTQANKQWLKELKRHVNQFHRQSQGYGLYMVEYLGKDWIFEHNCVRMPDADLVWKEIPVPGYIVNKCFKEKKIDPHTGDQYISWSEEGDEFRYYHSEERVQNAVKKYRDFFRIDNLSQYFSVDQVQLIVDRVVKLLDCRTWRDFAEYQLYWCGRIIKRGSVDLSEFDAESYYYIDQHQMDDECFWRDEEFDYHYYVIDQKYDQFRYFDDLMLLYKRLAKFVGNKKDDAFKENMRLQAIMKACGIKYKNK